MVREAFDDLEEGRIIGRKLIKEIRIADDKEVLASCVLAKTSLSSAIRRRITNTNYFLRRRITKTFVQLRFSCNLYDMKISSKRIKVSKVTTQE